MLHAVPTRVLGGHPVRVGRVLQHHDIATLGRGALRERAVHAPFAPPHPLALWPMVTRPAHTGNRSYHLALS
jgi:hypothetical protein